eukprot:COSAG02_NODE_5549_length_4236_cov_12.583998_1_plen_326_part_00
MEASDQHLSQLLMSSEAPVGLEVAAAGHDSSTPPGGMDAMDGNWMYSASRVDGPEERHSEAHRHVRSSRTLLEAVSAMSSEDAGQRSGLPHFSRPSIPRETASAREQPPIPKAPPPGVPRAAALPLRGPSEPVLCAEPSSPLSAGTECLGARDAPASPADAPFAFVREIRPYFLEKPRIKLQHRIGAALFHSANSCGVTERVGTKSEGSERRKVALELVRYLASDAPESGQIMRWKAHAICTRSFKVAHEAPQRRSALTTSAHGDQAAAHELSVQGATSCGLTDKEFYLLAIPKSEITKLQVSEETLAIVTLVCPRMSQYVFCCA